MLALAETARPWDSFGQGEKADVRVRRAAGRAYGRTVAETPGLDKTASNDPRTNEPAADDLGRRIAVAADRARLAIGWERLWPRLAWPLGVAALFCAVSWLGLWTTVPDAIRLGLVALFGLAFLGAFAVFRDFRWPTRHEALHRVELKSGLPHRPLETYEDRLGDGADPVARALWNAHRARIARSIATLAPGMPHPDLARADRYGLRVSLGLVLFVGLFAGAGEYRERISAAFRGAPLPVALASRVDAWVTPPGYTGRAPLFLTGENRVPVEKDGAIRVPQGSVVVVRTSPPTADKPADPTDVTATVAGKSEPVPVASAAAEGATPIAAGNGQPVSPPKTGKSEAPPAPRPGQPVEHTYALAKDAAITVVSGGRKIGGWTFVVEPDLPPRIRFVAEPEVQLSGTIKLAYEVQDDYGVVAAEAKIEPLADKAKTATGAAPRPLVGAPDFPLALPQGRMKSGQAQVFRDLTSHPWAGGMVRVTLVARDEAGQEGRSDTVEITLPSKPFRKPLARALVEQRRILATDANDAQKVATALDALTLGAEHFIEKSGHYFGLRMAYEGIVGAASDDQLREVVDLLWTVALSVEDGDLSLAEKALRDAQEALRKALENGASEQEIAKLTQELRKALDRYIAELAQKQRNNPQARSPMDPNARTMRKQDLDKMLDRIENLAKTGSKDAARQLLAEMQQMLENLQAGNPSGQQQGEQSEQSEALDKLGEMIQRQQQLMDKTHRLDRRDGSQRQPGQRGQQGDQGPMSDEELKQALEDLQKNQGDLQQALKDLRDKMAKGREQRGEGQQGKQGKGQNGKNGKGQDGQGQQAQRGKGKAQGRPGEQGQGGQGEGGEQGEGPEGQLGQAEGAMGEAREALGQGETGDAVDAQGRALDALRQGARQLADQMMQQPGRQPGGMQAGDAPSNEDPLGRPNRTGNIDPGKNLVPGEIDVQRARRVLEDIRRRLSDPSRPRIELDYLERLLQMR